MSWYLIELPDGALTPYATETEGGTVYGWGEMPKRVIDRDELLRIADDLDSGWGKHSDDFIPCEVVKYERAVAQRIRKAVGL